MSEHKRFEMWLGTQERRELTELAAEAGLTSADIMRLGFRWLKAHREVLVTGRPEGTKEMRP